MDPAFLTSEAFWVDPAPFAATAPGGRAPELSDCADLAAHVLFQTSGSSGEPRWIALSKQALHISAEAVNRHLGVDSASQWGLALPLHHVGGFGVAARARAAGCGFHDFARKWDAAAFAAWLDAENITHTSLVPTQVHDLAAAGLRAPRNLGAIVVGGGRLDDTTGRAARALGWPVLASYGMTEAGSQIATQAPASLGLDYRSAPIPLLDIWEAEVRAGGRLAIRGPALHSGTLVPEGNGWRFVKRENPWHETRDRVSLAGRLLTPLGRADSLVKVLGELVDPEEIERDLIRISNGTLGPGTFAVAAIPDERAGHALVPVFEGHATAEHGRWIADHNQRCEGFKRLGPAVRADLLPKSPLGKIRRAELAEWVAAHYGTFQ